MVVERPPSRADRLAVERVVADRAWRPWAGGLVAALYTLAAMVVFWHGWGTTSAVVGPATST